MMEQRSTALDILGSLMNLGVTLPMDGFGTGYSSTTYLKSFPVDALKMDRSMVEGLDEDVNTRAVISATTGLAQALGLAVEAEGVETAGELDELRSMGCDFAQGYYWQGRAPPRRRRSYWRPVRTRSRAGPLGASAPLTTLAAARS